MEKLSEYTLDELLDTARRLRALDDWDRVNDSIVFQLGNRSISIRASNATSFTRGLIRGYVKAANLDENREDLWDLR